MNKISLLSIITTILSCTSLTATNLPNSLNPTNVSSISATQLHLQEADDWTYHHPSDYNSIIDNNSLPPIIPITPEDSNITAPKKRKSKKRKLTNEEQAANMELSDLHLTTNYANKNNKSQRGSLMLTYDQSAHKKKKKQHPSPLASNLITNNIIDITPQQNLQNIDFFSNVPNEPMQAYPNILQDTSPSIHHETSPTGSFLLSSDPLPNTNLSIDNYQSIPTHTNQPLVSPPTKKRRLLPMHPNNASPSHNPPPTYPNNVPLARYPSFDLMTLFPAKRKYLNYLPAEYRGYIQPKLIHYTSDDKRKIVSFVHYILCVLCQDKPSVSCSKKVTCPANRFPFNQNFFQNLICAFPNKVTVISEAAFLYQLQTKFNADWKDTRLATRKTVILLFENLFYTLEKEIPLGYNTLGITDTIPLPVSYINFLQGSQHTHALPNKEDKMESYNSLPKKSNVRTNNLSPQTKSIISKRSRIYPPTRNNKLSTSNLAPSPAAISYPNPLKGNLHTNNLLHINEAQRHAINLMRKRNQELKNNYKALTQYTISKSQFGYSPSVTEETDMRKEQLEEFVQNIKEHYYRLTGQIVRILLDKCESMYSSGTLKQSEGLDYKTCVLSLDCKELRKNIEAQVRSDVHSLYQKALSATAYNWNAYIRDASNSLCHGKHHLWYVIQVIRFFEGQMMRFFESKKLEMLSAVIPPLLTATVKKNLTSKSFPLISHIVYTIEQEEGVPLYDEENKYIIKKENLCSVLKDLFKRKAPLIEEEWNTHRNAQIRAKHTQNYKAVADLTAIFIDRLCAVLQKDDSMQTTEKTNDVTADIQPHFPLQG